VAPAGPARLQMYMSAEQQLVNDVAWLPMEQVITTFVQKPCLAGVVSNAQDLTPPNDGGTIYVSTAAPCADTSSFQEDLWLRSEAGLRCAAVERRE